jgi:hypothetical protein
MPPGAVVPDRPAATNAIRDDVLRGISAFGARIWSSSLLLGLTVVAIDGGGSKPVAGLPVDPAVEGLVSLEWNLSGVSQVRLVS